MRKWSTTSACVHVSVFGTIFILNVSMIKWTVLSASCTVMLAKAVYYAGIILCSYAACIILCSKLCWHNLPRPKMSLLSVGMQPLSFKCELVECNQSLLGVRVRPEA